MLVSHNKFRTALNFEVTTTLNWVLPVFSDKKFLSSLSLCINITKRSKVVRRWLRHRLRYNVAHRRLASERHYAYDVIEMCAPLRWQHHLWGYRSRTRKRTLNLF